jgi:hypothetical protein
MWGWSLGQAGFGEQIQLYGDTFWRQVGITLLWASAVMLAVLAFVALVVTRSRRPDVIEGTGRRRLLKKLSRPRSAHVHGTRREPPGRMGPRAA